uniref:IP06047p n=1 Tax=Drosophila melanogaster TaxID=7227 RepID=Q9VWQ4_DROME|nr:IP06047p [Drosophila melanogaster]AOQ12571.1 CG6900-PB [synthetic construct]
MHFRSLFWRAVVRSEDRLGDPAGYIRNQMGDEMSKHKKFIFLTWIGQEVGVIQRAKMSTDKALIKDVLNNFAVELQAGVEAELDIELFREALNLQVTLYILLTKLLLSL